MESVKFPRRKTRIVEVEEYLRRLGATTSAETAKEVVNGQSSGELQEVESDLPEDIRDRALSVFRAAVSDKATVQQAIEKVQKEALVEVETRFKGQRFKVLFYHEPIYNPEIYMPSF